MAIPQPVPELLTLITSQFLHAGFAHVGFNMWFLWIFGNNIEEELGGFKYLVFYLLCGVLAGLTQWFFSAQAIDLLRESRCGGKLKIEDSSNQIEA